MKSFKGKITAVLLSGLLVLSVLGGCTPQRKLAPPDNTRPPAPSPTPRPNQQDTPEQARDAQRDIELKLETTPAIKDAYVVVLGNVALIGLDIKEGKQEEGTNQAKADATRIAEADRRVIDAYVTADPDMVPRIREIADGIRQGRPITEFVDEIMEMINRLAPTGDRVPNQPAL